MNGVMKTNAVVNLLGGLDSKCRPVQSPLVLPSHLQLLRWRSWNAINAVLSWRSPWINGLRLSHVKNCIPLFPCPPVPHFPSSPLPAGVVPRCVTCKLIIRAAITGLVCRLLYGSFWERGSLLYSTKGLPTGHIICVLFPRGLDMVGLVLFC